MANCETTKINLRQLARSGETLHFTLTTDDFHAIEQDELLGGNVEAELKATEKAGDLFQVKIKAHGEVTVPCDRCLEELTLPIDVEDILLLSEEDSDNPNILPIQGTPENYDAVWDIYETLVTNLPLERTHPEGECNAEMLSRIQGLSPDDDEQED